jgi:hypothetical protein
MTFRSPGGLCVGSDGGKSTGGTTFTFVTDRMDVAVGLAREAADGRDVAVSGGVRLFEGDGIAALALEQVRVIEAPGVTHLVYRTQTA